MKKEMSLQKTLDWYNEKIIPLVSGQRSKASKQIDVIKSYLAELQTIANRFDYSDVKDATVYQNYSTTIYEKTLEIFSEINAPEQITFINIDNYCKILKNSIDAYINILAKYLSWLRKDRSFKQKVKALDRTLGKLRKEVMKFENKTLVEYGEIVAYEKVSEDIDTLITNVEKKISLKEEIAEHKDEVERLDNLLEAKETELKTLEGHPGFQQLLSNRKELEHIDITISNTISEIKKLCSKVLKAVETKKIAIDDPTKELYKSLIKDPMHEIVNQADGYPSIKNALDELKQKSTDPAIQMKKDKLERAFENIEEIKNDGLLELQQRAKYLLKQNDAITSKFKEMDMERKIEKTRKEIENLKIDKERVTISEKRELEKVDGDIKQFTKSIEERIAKFTNEEITLILK